MNSEVKPSIKSPFLLAIGLHVLLLIILFIHFTFSSNEPPVTQSSTNVIQAVAVNSSELQQQLSQASAPQPAPAKPQPPVPKPQVAVPVKQTIVKPPTPAPPPPKVVQAPPQQQPPTDVQIKQAQALNQAQQLATAAAQAAIQQAQQAAAQKKRAQKAALKLAQQQAAVALSDQLQAQTAQEKKLAQQKQLQTAQQATQQLIQQEISASANAPTNTTPTLSAAAQGEVDKYKALIIQAISQQWIVPDIKNKNETCKLIVHLAPGGMVVSVEISQSSGDSVLDRSAQTAVYKASPLPLPKDPALFNNFQEISLTVKPQSIIAGN